MALTQKDVFYALLSNNQTNLSELCRKTSISYHKLSKRLDRHALHKLPISELARICDVLQISMEDLITLMQKAASGGFSEGYPRGEIVLKRIDSSHFRNRTFVEALSQEEVELIQAFRAAVRQAHG